MLNTKCIPIRKFGAFKGTGLMSLLLILTLLGSVFVLSAVGATMPDSPEVQQLKQNAGSAFVKGDYAQAAAFALEIAEKHPGTEARHYAVQMLGTLYENNIVDLKKAIKWDREFLEKYADSRQAPYYQEKLASLDKLLTHEEGYKAYVAIQIAHEPDEVMVKKFEALLRQYPDFILKDQVERDLGYAYGRLDERKKSALAFQSIASPDREKLSSTDKIEYGNAHRYWRMRSTWAYAAWTLILALWALVLWMNPWKQLTWASTKKFLLWPVLWLVVTGASMPFFFSMETKGYPIVIPAITVCIAIGLNLIVLFWLLLLIKGSVWQSRLRARRWLSPVLAVLMTTGVFYLWVVYQPNGPYIVDVCVVKLDYWRVEFREWVIKHRTRGQFAGAQGNRSAELAPTAPHTLEGSK